MKYKIGDWCLTKEENWGDDGQYIIITEESNKPDYVYGVLITHKHHEIKEDWYPENRIDRKLAHSEKKALKDKMMVEKF